MNFREKFMNVQECIKKRSSCRKYTNIPIPIETIYDILNAAIWAPSPKNRQPWRFTVLQGESKKQIINECIHKLCKNSGNVDYLMDKEICTENHTLKIIEQAPVLILVFNALPSETVLNSYNVTFDYLNMQAIGASIQNMLLRATEIGLGSLWIGDILSAEQTITEYFPNSGKLVAGVVIGFSIEEDVVHSRRVSLSESITYIGG